MHTLLAHPFGITIVTASLLMAGTVRFLPGLDLWSGQAAWILFCGVLAYAASTVALLWPRPDGSPAGPDELSSAGWPMDAVLTGAAAEKRLRRQALQQPTTLLPLGLALITAAYVPLLAPTAGGAPWAIAVLAASVLGGAGSFAWHYGFRHSERYAGTVRELTAALEQERTRLERADDEGMADRLREGFAGVTSAQGAEALSRLEDEFMQLMPVLEVRRDTEPTSMLYIGPLARETYRRGLSVLDDALELMRAVRMPARESQEAEIAGLEAQAMSSYGGQGQTLETEIRNEKLGPYRTRKDMMDQVQGHVDRLLHQVDQCEVSLYRTRVEIATIRVGSSGATVDSVVRTLERTIEQVKEVQQELDRLGY